MKYNDLKKCLNLAEVICESGGMNLANVDVCFVNEQRVTVAFDSRGAEIEISIKPKGADNEYIH